MSTLIVGGGAAGLYASILLKKKHPAEQIVVLDKEEKIARKMYATGNGHCNLLNRHLEPAFYSHPEFMAPILAKYDFSMLCALLESWGIALREEGDCVYPESYNAGCYVSLLSQIAKSLGVEFVLGCRAEDYSQKERGFAVNIEKGFKPLPIFDNLLFAVGGLSSPNLGSDGSFYSCLKEHGYHLVPPEPGLAPLKLFSSVSLKPLAGFRHEAKVTLLDSKGHSLYAETGEVLFKEDGISGIVVFNIESVYVRLKKPVGATLSLDYFPSLSFEGLLAHLTSVFEKNPRFFLSSFFPYEMGQHLCLALGKKEPSSFSNQDLVSLTKLLKEEKYPIVGTYDFRNSQVTIGGVSLEELGPHLESKREEKVAFAGEIIDIDGMCGGYNLAWSLISALLVSEVL